MKLSDHPNSDGAVVFHVDSIKKSYGGVHALKGVTLDLRAGEILGLCGENGSGKSTLLKIISGQINADSGEMTLDGQKVEFRSPIDALQEGIGTVTQERTLVPDLTVFENIYLSHTKPRSIWGISWDKTRKLATDLLNKIGADISPDVLVAELLPGEAQMVEIARALNGNIRILILDEPTSSLTSHEVEKLFAALENLKKQGVAIIFISHRLEEIYAICDRLAILRDGNLVSAGPIEEYSKQRLIHDMIGRDPDELEVSEEIIIDSHPVLAVKEFSLGKKFSDINFQLHKGEILGLIGLVGAGHSDLLEAIFGLHRECQGTLEVNGQLVEVNSPRDAMKHNLAFVPADRKKHGLVLGMSVLENAVMASTANKNRLMRPKTRPIEEKVKSYSKDFNIVHRTLDEPILNLSGGNQQKVLLTKWLGTDPTVLFLDEPTRGVDVGAKTEIYKILLDQRAKGLSIVVSSSEIPELLVLCDRIMVMFRGKIVAHLNRAQAEESRIVQYAMGQGES